MIMCDATRAANCRSPVKVVKGSLGRRLSKIGAGRSLKMSQMLGPPKNSPPRLRTPKVDISALGRFNIEGLRQWHRHREPVQGLI